MIAAAAAMTMTATPVMAAPAGAATSLSGARSARASTLAGNRSEVAGGGLVGIIIAAGIVAIGIIAIVDDTDDDPDSN